MASLNYHGVGTGDVIGSAELGSVERTDLPDVLYETFANVRRAVREPEQVSFSVVRGDGWQCYCRDPELALALLLRFSCLLEARDIPTRFALSIDEVDLLKEDLNESSGRAFTRSGKALDSLRKEQRVRCLPPEEAGELSQLAMDGVSENLDLLLKEWTSPQAQAVGKMLQNSLGEPRVTQADVAKSWEPDPITRQTVNRHLNRANWPIVQRILSRYNRIVRLSSGKSAAS